MDCRACGAGLPDAAPRCPDCGRDVGEPVLDLLQGDTVLETFRLRPGEQVAGRGLDSDICLTDASVSRSHARLEYAEEDGSVHVQDLGSTQGVFVNGKRVERTRLSPGDGLRLGQTRLRLRLDDPRQRPRGSSAEPPAAELTLAGRADLLLSVLESINASLAVHEVCERVIDGVMKITGAERGFVLLSGRLDASLVRESAERVGDMRLLASRHLSPDRELEGVNGISTSALRRVEQTGETIATGNAMADPTLKPSSSVADLELRTIVCLPLKSPRRGADGQAQPPLGALYVDSHALSAGFSPDSLTAAEVLARHATLAIENALLFEREERTIDELRAARDKAFEASRAKSLFLANMSHELHTPLNAILNYSDMVRERAAELGHPELLADLTKIRESGKHLLQLIDDVLDVSQLEQGTLKLKVGEYEVAPILGKLARRAQPLVQANGNVLEVDAPDDLGSVQGDARRVRQILFGLLANAAKFTERGTVRLAARRSAHPGSAQQLTFRVSDSGIGMTPDQLARIFDPFTQIDESETRRHGGMGLGLALAERLAKRMGGVLEVESRAGEGSTFTLRLPTEAPPDTGD